MVLHSLAIRAAIWSAATATAIWCHLKECELSLRKLSPGGVSSTPRMLPHRRELCLTLRQNRSAPTRNTPTNTNTPEATAIPTTNPCGPSRSMVAPTAAGPMMLPMQ